MDSLESWITAAAVQVIMSAWTWKTKEKSVKETAHLHHSVKMLLLHSIITCSRLRARRNRYPIGYRVAQFFVVKSIHQKVAFFHVDVDDIESNSILTCYSFIWRCSIVQGFYLQYQKRSDPLFLLLFLMKRLLSFDWRLLHQWHSPLHCISWMTHEEANHETLKNHF